MLDFVLSTGDEITAALGLRLKAVRLSQSIADMEQAQRAKRQRAPRKRQATVGRQP